MYAPKELHFLAVSAGLDDETVTVLWQDARKAAQEILGATDHRKYDHETHDQMLWLIENKLSQDVPANLLPWVMVDFHVASLIVDAQHAAHAVGSYIKNHLPGKHTG